MYDHLHGQSNPSQLRRLIFKIFSISTIFPLFLLRRTSAFVPRSTCASRFTKDFGMMTSTASLTTSLYAENTLASFLAYIPTSVKLSSDSKYHISIGNEAGDADSILSSLSLSYVNSLSKKDTCNSADEITSLPLVSINRNDLSLRRDVMIILEMAGIDAEALIFLDDEIFQTVAKDDSIRKQITLVDHNKLRYDLWSLKNDVVEILDHHQDEGEHESVEGKVRNIAFDGKIALVGSTCTLITERLMELENTSKVDAGLGLVLLSVILLDTMNMSEEAGKGTARDQLAVDFLMRFTIWDALEINDETAQQIYNNSENKSGPPCRSSLYEYLRDSKFDVKFWNSMSVINALRIDYKRFEPSSENASVFGLSSVLLDMSDLMSKKSFYDDAIAYMAEAGIGLLGVLTMVIVDDKPQRELLLVGEENRVDSMTQFLLHSDAASFLEMSRANDDVTIGGGMIATELKQGNPKGSRKQVAPVMLMHVGDKK